MPEMPNSEILQALYTGDSTKAEELLRNDPLLDVFEAAAAGKTERVRELLEQDPSAANAWAEDGFQPLGLASFFGHVDTARVLVEGGADVNSASRNDFKVMPLHSACAAGDPDTRYELAKLLLEHGGRSERPPAGRVHASDGGGADGGRAPTRAPRPARRDG